MTAEITPDVTLTKRVLVVEDSEDIRFLLSLWLSDDPRCTGVAEATSVAEALTAAQGDDVDAVVLDFMLGDGSAADCLPQMRAAWPDARIVVYTASVRIAQEAGLMDMGADDIVEKLTVVVEDVVELVLGTDHQTVAA
jgi:DNA-binding response OmpR family regulator